MSAFLLLLSLLFPAQSAPVDPVRNLRLRLVEEINRDRKAAGVPPVEYSEELSRAADEHCLEMLREDYISHWDHSGRKPYMRYALAGITDFTSENIWSLWSSNLNTAPSELWKQLLAGHRSFVEERPPNDGHRQSVLAPHHTHVGIGLAFDGRGMRMVEVFSARYAQLKPLPLRATLHDRLKIEGKITNGALKVFGVEIYYEPLPHSMSHAELRATYAYSLPDEVSMQRPWLGDGMYVDGTEGTIYFGDAGRFSLALPFWKNVPGVYSVGVWLQDKRGGKPFLGAMTSVFVEAGVRNAR
jgi:uncharacterized protein YkwD